MGVKWEGGIKRGSGWDRRLFLFQKQISIFFPFRVDLIFEELCHPRKQTPSQNIPSLATLM